MTATSEKIDGGGVGMYLPNFCDSRNVFVIVIIAELVAIILTIARTSVDSAFWLSLAWSSLFLIWVALMSAAALCVARPFLEDMSAARVTVISMLLLLATTALLSEVAWLIGQWFSASDTIFPQTHGTFLLRNIAIAAIVSVMVLRYLYVTYEWRRNVQAESRSRVQLLQARIRPHFLFNSLNTVASLTRSDPAAAEEAIEDLSDLFRANLREQRERISLKEELESARMYQRIEQLRLGDRLHVEWNLNDVPLRASVPSLTVQPLLENAIYHGIEPLPEGGTVRIEGRQDGNWVELSVSNPLPPDRDQGHRRGNKLALENVAHRIALAYENGSLDVQDGPDVFRVTLRFPYLKGTP